MLEAKVWGIPSDERYADEVAPGDVALIYVASEEAFIGRAELATAVREWSPSEAEAPPGDRGVSLADVERWDPPVSLASVVRRIDPTASNPIVQTNAAAGFATGVVRITDDEYEAAIAAARDARGRR